jgi:ATP-dependent DNA ligase
MCKSRRRKLTSSRSTGIARRFMSSVTPAAPRTVSIAISPAPDAGPKVKGTVWTLPELFAEVNYRGLTATGELRHATFKGLYKEI